MGEVEDLSSIAEEVGELEGGMLHVKLTRSSDVHLVGGDACYHLGKSGCHRTSIDTQEMLTVYVNG